MSTPRPGIHPLSPLLWRYLGFLIPTLIVLAAVTLLMYRLDLGAEQRIHEERGRHIVTLQSEIITREIRSIVSDLHLLRSQAVLLDFLENPSTPALRLAGEYVLFTRQRGLYDQIRYLDETGAEIVRVNQNEGNPAAVSGDELQAKGTRYYFGATMALAPGETFVSPFDLNVEHGEVERPLKPVIRFATPVLDRRDRRRGILVLNYLGSRLLRMLSETSSAAHGPVMLLDQDGFWIRGQPGNEDALLLGSQRSFAREEPEAWGRITATSEGEHLDTSGLFTHRRVPLGERRDDPALLVVRRVSREVLSQRPRELLRRILPLEGLIVLLVAVPSWFLARSGAQRREFQRRLLQSEKRLRALSVQLLSAQEDERRKISRDLHDDLGQVVTAITLDLERALGETRPDRAADSVRRALDANRTMLRKVHEMSSSLRPPLLDDLGLEEAVRSYIGEYQSRYQIEVLLRLRIHPGACIPRTVQENVYRIVQEALTNVSKYAQVDEVEVAIESREDAMTLTVVDHGKGFRPDDVDPRSLGLLGMRERAELLDGEFELTARPGTGTRIAVSIPLYPDAPAGTGRTRAPGVGTEAERR